MNTHSSINNNIVHLWRANLNDFASSEQYLHQLLNADERHRAQRFHFPLHRQRYTTARALLRKILSFYTGIVPEKINFSYGPHGKPFLSENPLHLEFNVSHSHDMAVYGFTTNIEIGVDIEKVEAHFKEGVARRFFTEQEFSELMQLPESARVVAFYRIWSRKEALIKALGEGLYGPIKDFSISLKQEVDLILLSYQQHEYHFSIQSFEVDPDYQSAFATVMPVEQIVHWQWAQQGPESL